MLKKALARPQSCSSNESPFALDIKHATSLLYQVRVADQRIQNVQENALKNCQHLGKAKLAIVVMPQDKNRIGDTTLSAILFFHSQ
jgi:hypothetical protein